MAEIKQAAGCYWLPRIVAKENGCLALVARGSVADCYSSTRGFTWPTTLLGPAAECYGGRLLCLLFPCY